MKLVIPNELHDDETRVAMDPPTVKKLIELGFTVTVESGLGVASHHSDAVYTDQGATVAESDDFETAWGEADLICQLHAPGDDRAGRIKSGAILLGMMQPLGHLDLMTKLAEQKVTVLSAEFIPRISRAQAMDVLSSQANIGGYMAVLLAARACPKIFPMMITAAGTIAPSRVFILGAGVAGLQAIATAKRLGAVVEAYDVRPEVEEQVKSLGGRFVKLPTAKQDSTATGGYAKQQTDEERQKQIELMTKHVAGADAVVTTAAVFGKAPPMLIPKDMVDQMRAGSVIVDIAANPEAGRGNCELTKPGEVYVTDNGVIIDGTTNLPGLAPIHSSQMYANNMLAFIREIVNEGAIQLDLEDEIQKGACIVHDGEVRNALVKDALGQTSGA